MLAETLADRHTPGRILSNETAGRFLGLTRAEREAMDRDGVVIRTLTPIDESVSDRFDRKREKTRIRNINHRERKRQQRANSVTAQVAILQPARDATVYKEKASRVVATFDREPDRVIAAVMAGASTPAAIATATSLPITTIRPLLSRLVRAGQIASPERGRYAIVEEHHVEHP